MATFVIDTTLLIDLQRERSIDPSMRKAAAFLHKHSTVQLLLPSIALGEYLEGFADPDSPDARGLIAGLRILEVNGQTAKTYARIARKLRSVGQLIGANDLWIGCTALSAKLPPVSRDSTHFSRIPGLTGEIARSGMGVVHKALECLRT